LNGPGHRAHNDACFLGVTLHTIVSAFGGFLLPLKIAIYLAGNLLERGLAVCGHGLQVLVDAL